MSDLTKFLMENPVDNLTDEIVVSKRLSEFPFKIRAMTGPEFSNYQKRSASIGKNRRVDFDVTKFNELVVINHTIVPNFKDAEDIKKAGCATPEQYLYKSLLAGEIAELAQEISALSGFDRDLEDTIEDAKNS